jgi:extradiol dioxygenase family protein
MRNSKNVFHLAIPCRDLDEAQDFYNSKLGCKLARRYNDRITLDFFGDQLVCHLSPEDVVKEPKMYPRHFGITFYDRNEFDTVLNLAQERDLDFFAPPSQRFEGKIEQHECFFLKDPSNNLIEFKYYNDPRMMY